MAAGVVATFAMAWFLGNRERNRLGVSGATSSVGPVTLAFERDQGVARPRLIVFNLALTIVVLVSAVLRLLPMPLLFMAGLSLALVVNYPAVSAQRARLTAHAANALPIVLLILAAGIFTGVMTGTGMVDAMARGAMTAVPDRFGPWLGPITALLSAPLTFALSNDAYYFGVVPVIAQTAALHGIAPVEIARASLLGQPIHVLSPLVAAIYLVAGLLDCEVGAMQSFSLKWASLLTIVLIVAALASRAII